MKLEAGKTYEVWFPFYRTTWFPPDVDAQEVETWAPGWRMEGRDIGYGEAAFDEKWDGDGALLIELVSLHKPGKSYAERAFYVRQWRDPNGKIFGKRNLRCISSRAIIEWLGGSKTDHLEHDPRTPKYGVAS